MITFTGGYLFNPKDSFDHNYSDDQKMIFFFGGEGFPGAFQQCIKCKVKRYPNQETRLSCDEMLIKNIIE